MNPDQALGMRNFRFQPLTPIHIGSGERISPEEYVVDVERKEIVRLSFPAVLAAMAEPDRKRFESALDQGRLKDAQSLIQQTWRQRPPAGRGMLERYRAECGERSFQELRQVIEQPGRSGDVMALVRNPVTGNVVVPGSAIKGAIRTALVSRYAQGLADGEKRAFNTGAARNRKLAHVMEMRVLDYTDRELQRDPFRLLSVSDVDWPSNLVRIDKPELRKLGRDGGETSGIQMHFERLKSFVDGVQTAWPMVDITLNPEPRKWESAGKKMDWGTVREACNDFYWNRLDQEEKRFSIVSANAESWRPNALDFSRGAIFLRVGRHCHFDSASVEGFRRKPVVAFRRGTEEDDSFPGPQIGNTRTMCPVHVGQTPFELPFGWALLEPV